MKTTSDAIPQLAGMDCSEISVPDAINGLKHLSDDHPCCRVFAEAVIVLLGSYHGKCLCGAETGWTTVKCCNLCGRPVMSESWHIVPNVRDDLLGTAGTSGAAKPITQSDSGGELGRSLCSLL